MTASPATIGGTSSDRTVFAAAALFAVSAALLLLLLLWQQFEPRDSFQSLFFGGEILLWVVMVIAVGRGASLALFEMSGRRRTAASALDARTQVETLFHMADMLQSAMVYADANAVLAATAQKLLPDLGGALYTFNNSGDRLDLSTSWNWGEGCHAPRTISPSQCWALKRSKPHVNDLAEGSLACDHHEGNIATLEIPMMARGEIHGLLMIVASGDDSLKRLAAVTPVAMAIADAMSLTLSNIALREKLRTQALRDPLTGLYNRRYMEDVLDRYANLAERNHSSLSAIMIDLDHFKRVNDQHGHAQGDAVLGEVAAAIVGGIRPCDVACRYGGEELVVLLPDCGLTEAVAKAEGLRARIESLSENHGFRITASFGVASIPETVAKGAELLACADEALRHAKQDGRNRVVEAPARHNLNPPLNLVAAE